MADDDDEDQEDEYVMVYDSSKTEPYDADPATLLLYSRQNSESNRKPDVDRSQKQLKQLQQHQNESASSSATTDTTSTTSTTATTTTTSSTQKNSSKYALLFNLTHKINDFFLY